eukprot:CAMPEP_0173385422 /NCGR_PEP_ID=MMETSP1356-20130122/8033_1 /TAXON_ID=77927 ORGANISM="Hemiselmis virescens, Strain PCC157" /NCGR_SAMPLE_ID=MMETSP1356 /ASSEMBLY_ACC=CAM_ASM_000847 /LENGTH=85 /DNA_ID=CAMNT_0014341219 /DNA_START=333 /DNA_END=587 /DNA_ORIENTATION=-
MRERAQPEAASGPFLLLAEAAQQRHDQARPQRKATVNAAAAAKLREMEDECGVMSEEEEDSDEIGREARGVGSAGGRKRTRQTNV